MRPSALENCAAQPPGLRLRASPWLAAGTRAPAHPGIRAPPPDRSGCARNRAHCPPPRRTRNPVRRPGLSCLVNRSSVARGTTRQRARRLNLVFRHQPAADLFLIARRLITHRGDEFTRPDILFGMAVAVQAPFHLQRVLLPRERHSVHAAVAALATHSLIDVNAVI